MTLRVLGIIPARGGSKGILRKNLAPLAGRPLLAYTVSAAQRAKLLSRIILSTEDNEIAEVGRQLGVDVPFKRPPELGQDDTPGIAVLQHAVLELERQGERFDAIFALQPTNPLRQPDDIDGAIQLLDRTGADSVIAFVDVGERHPARMKYIGADGRVLDPFFGERVEGQRRQDLPKLYLREGSVYLTRRDVLMIHGSLKGADCRAWLIPQDRSCNIDEPFDLALAEWLLRRRPGLDC